MRNLARRLCLLVSVGAVALTAMCTWLASASNARERGRQPDLVISRAEASGSHYAFKGDDFTLRIHYVMKNTGHATAGASRTGIYVLPQFAGRHPRRIELLARRMPRLHRGDTDSDGFEADFSTRPLPLGAYEVEVCADARHRIEEESEGNNCRGTGREFYVIKEDWEGSISGVGGCCGAAKVEKWHSSGGAHLTFGKYLGDGVFRYDFNGVMKWDVSGVNQGGCTLSGSGTEPVDEDNSGPGIKLKYGNGRYLGTETLDDPFFTIFFTGGGGFPCSAMEDGPANLDFLQIDRHDLVFDQRELKGRYDFGGAAEGAIWKWDFN